MIKAPRSGVPRTLLPTPMSPLRWTARRAGWLLPLVALSLTAGALPAQDIIRSAADWRTIRTQWFDLHYPTDTEAWAQDLAPRLDAMRDAVAALIGYAPRERTTIVIDDPYNVANGKALPILGAPTVHLWVTPPGPTEEIANHRGWGMKLAAHEFAHVAHLGRPARRTQWYWHLLPARVSPLAAFTPRWALEGYATWIEGRITGSGRPHGAWRPALLRELAVEGRLPSYGGLSAGGGYKGGSMAYLAGSAYWEWLAARRGDSSMTQVFRRQSARVGRSFDEAFRGVYGDSPSLLYGRFAAELTAKSFMVDSALRRSGFVRGTHLARYGGAVGGPAASRDGQRIALVLPPQGTGGTRVIVTRPDTQPTSTLERQQVKRQLARDPQDVAAVRVSPRLVKALATLKGRRGRTFGNPRFIDAAGTLLLLESWSVRPDATRRPDLMVWNTATNTVTPVTDGAAVQDADPSPDGTRAAAVRCIGGACSLVLVSMTTGAVTTLAAGSPTKVFSHPRWSPDGTQLVTTVQDRDGLWRVALVDPASGAMSVVTPDDDVNRHSASFDATGRELVYVSEDGGIPNVESLRLHDGLRTQRTRVFGSVYEPAPLPGNAVLYLAEYAGGMDLFRVGASIVVRGQATGADAAALVPAVVRPREPAIELATQPVAPPVAYRAGPRRYRLIAQTSLARDGLQHSGVLSSVDPANRLAWMAAGYAGTRGAWTGGVGSAAWYGSRPNLRTEAFWLEQRASAQRNAGVSTLPDLRVAGGSMSATLPLAGTSLAQRVSLSGFAGAAASRGDAARFRATVTAQYGAATVIGWQRTTGMSVRAAAGTLGDSSFARVSAGAYVNAFRTRLEARLHQASRGTPRLEHFSAGGFMPPLSDEATLAQRIAIPALPAGIVTGRELFELRIARPSPFRFGTIYAHSIGSTWKVDRHSAVVGIEQGVDLDYLGLVGLPRLRALVGVARVIRGPLAAKGSAYLSIGWRP